MEQSLHHRSARWALFVVIAFFPTMAMAQAVAAPFGPALGLLKGFLSFCQLAAGLYLVKDGYDVGRAVTQGHPHGKEMQENWAKGAIWIFGGGVIVEWIKRAYLASGTTS